METPTFQEESLKYDIEGKPGMLEVRATTPLETFLKNYYDGNWDICIRDINKYKSACIKMSAYYECMLYRLRSGKPNDWDGIYRATSK